jgi:hypothetical protein
MNVLDEDDSKLFLSIFLEGSASTHHFAAPLQMKLAIRRCLAPVAYDKCKIHLSPKAAALFWIHNIFTKTFLSA